MVIMQDGRYVILYIDDDQDYLDAVREILEAENYVMAEAQSAEDGLRVYKRARPDWARVWCEAIEASLMDRVTTGDDGRLEQGNRGAGLQGNCLAVPAHG